MQTCQPRTTRRLAIRSVVFGTAVSQVVALSYLLNPENEQTHNDSPVIVLLFVALVFDIGEYNKVGGTENQPTNFLHAESGKTWLLLCQ